MSLNETTTYFNVRLEFDKEKLDEIIDDAISSNKVGYVCSVESNNLTVANTNPEFFSGTSATHKSVLEFTGTLTFSSCFISSLPFTSKTVNRAFAFFISFNDALITTTL